MYEIPCAYQGGKVKIANAILSHIHIREDDLFYDLCCGSGAVSLALVNLGFPAKNIIMLDSSLWGRFWGMIGNGTFQLDVFKGYLDAIPKDRSKIKDHMSWLYKQPAYMDQVYIYLILQAGSFGSQAIWLENKQWKNGSFRSFWQPTPTSNRRSAVNPMMPMPDTMYNRVAKLCEGLQGITAIHGDIWSIKPRTDSVVYIDPPYANTAGYGYTFDVLSYIKSLDTPVWVSEYESGGMYTYEVGKQNKGGMSGRRTSKHIERLNLYNAGF